MTALGLDVYLYDGKNRAPEVKSDKYPGHLFRKTYLRSSYNQGGFNRVADNLVGKDLYWVFEPGDRYKFTPNWQKCRERAVQLAQELRQAVADNPFQVATVGPNAFGPLPSVDDKAALSIFLTERKRYLNEKDAPFSSYGNSHGTFFMKNPMPVVAAIPGVDVLGTPAVHLIYRSDELDWYVQGAEIVVEFIDHAMTLSNPVLHWSG